MWTIMHSVQWRASGRMSRITIFAVLSIASAALAEFNYSTCEEINDIKNKTHSLGPSAFSLKLDSCHGALYQTNVSLTNGTVALLKVYNAIDKHKKCSLTGDMENKLVECVTSKTGFTKDAFTTQAGKDHFGLDSTEALVFNNKQCKMSAILSHCIEEKFSAEKLSHGLKRCKDNIIRAFNVTANLCHDFLVRLDRSSGFTDLPSKTLILGTVAMLAKLAILFLY